MLGPVPSAPCISGCVTIWTCVRPWGQLITQCATPAVCRFTANKAPHSGPGAGSPQTLTCLSLFCRSGSRSQVPRPVRGARDPNPGPLLSSPDLSPRRRRWHTCLGENRCLCRGFSLAGKLGSSGIMWVLHGPFQPRASLALGVSGTQFPPSSWGLSPRRVASL